MGQNKSPSNSGAGVVAVAAGVAGVAGIFAIVASWEEWVESAELSAAEYYLKSTPGLDKPFELKLLNSKGTSFKDLSSTTTLVFAITELDINNSDTSFYNPNKKLLILFLNSGWINEYGIDFTKVIPVIFTSNDWFNLYKEFLNISGFPKIESLSKMKLLKKVTENDYLAETEKERYFFPGSESDNSTFYIATGVEIKYNRDISVSQTKLTFGGSPLNENLIQERHKINSDTYYRKDYNTGMSILYNENKLCIFLKDEKVLVQLRNNVLTEINLFLLNLQGSTKEDSFNQKKVNITDRFGNVVGYRQVDSVDKGKINVYDNYETLIGYYKKNAFSGDWEYHKL